MDKSRYSHSHYPLAFDELLIQLGRPTLLQFAAAFFGKSLVTTNELRTHILSNPILGLFLYRFHFIFLTKRGFTTDDFRTLIHATLREPIGDAFTYHHAADTPLIDIPPVERVLEDDYHLMGDTRLPDTRVVDNLVLSMLDTKGIDIKGARRALRRIMGQDQIRRFRELWVHCQSVCNRAPGDRAMGEAPYSPEQLEQIYTALPIQRVARLRVAARMTLSRLIDKALPSTSSSSLLARFVAAYMPPIKIANADDLVELMALDLDYDAARWVRLFCCDESDYEVLTRKPEYLTSRRLMSEAPQSVVAHMSDFLQVCQTRYPDIFPIQYPEALIEALHNNAAPRQSPGRPPAFLRAAQTHCRPPSDNHDPVDTMYRDMLVEWYTTALVDPVTLSHREMLDARSKRPTTKQSKVEVSIDIVNRAMELESFLEGLHALVARYPAHRDLHDALIREPLSTEHLDTSTAASNRFTKALFDLMRDYSVGSNEVRQALSIVDEDNDSNNNEQDEI